MPVIPRGVNSLAKLAGTKIKGDVSLSEGANITLTPSGQNIAIASTAGGGDALVANPLSQFAATTSAQLAGVISDETGTDKLVYNTSPTLVTPILGVATATSINKITLTQPASGSTLTILDGKTLTINDTMTLAGAYTLTIPATGTAALLATANVFTANQKINVNSTTALFVEQDGVNDNLFIVDTTNNTVSMGGTSLSNIFTTSIQTNVTSDLGASAGAVWLSAYAKAGATALDDSIYALYFDAGTNAAQSGTVTNLMAIRGVVNHFSTAGTLSNAYGIYFQMHNRSTGVITKAYNIYLANVNNASTGSIGTGYGLYIVAQTAPTTNYAIVTNAGLIVFNEAGDSTTDVRIEGDTDINLLFTDASADKVGIGDSAPGEKLDVAGNINATGVIKIDDVQVVSNRVVDARADDVTEAAFDALYPLTAGLIDALRDAMISHGLISAT